MFASAKLVPLQAREQTIAVLKATLHISCDQLVINLQSVQSSNKKINLLLYEI